METFDTSSELYKEDIDEDTYYKKLYGDGITEFAEQLLYMDRCIKLPYMDTDAFLNKWISTAKFPIIEGKLLVNRYSEIEDFIYEKLKQFPKKTKKIYGPVYILISQAPYIRNIHDDCKVDNLYIQFNYSYNQFKNQSRIITYNTDKDIPKICKNTIHSTRNQKMSVRIYICLPTYNKKGQFVYRSWENVKCNMKELLKYRNKDKYCFLNCVDSDISCGCMSQDTPYKSRCLGDNEKLDDKHYTYANLFLLNTKHANRYLDKELFSDDKVYIYPYDNNLEYCATNMPILEFNKMNTDVILELGKSYIIKHNRTNKCLYDTGNLLIGDCIKNDNRYKWFVESVSETQIAFKNKATNRYLYKYLFGGNSYLGTSVTTKTPFNYYNNQIVSDNKTKYVDIKDDKVKVLDIILTSKSKMVSLNPMSINKYAYIHILNNSTGLEYFNNRLAFSTSVNDYQRWIFEPTSIQNSYRIKHYKSGKYLHQSYVNNKPTIEMVSPTTKNITVWDITNNTLKSYNTNSYIGYNTPSITITTTPYVWNFVGYENAERIWKIEEAIN